MKDLKINYGIKTAIVVLLFGITIGCNKEESENENPPTTNNPPVAELNVTPMEGTAITNFTIDASNSHDIEDSNDKLLYRWYFDNWTDWSSENQAMHYFEDLGSYTVKLEVKDTDENISNDEQMVQITSSLGESCPELQFVEYGGQSYTTILIGTQCWLRQNLNIGSQISIDEDETDNGIIEKHCINDDPDMCNKYGGLYHWDEMMQYTTQEGAQGICPEGWHIPTHEEWKILEGTVDIKFGVNDPEWEKIGHRGYNAGKNLKSLSDWSNPGTDAVGFRALPGGRWCGHHHYHQVDTLGGFWTSSSEEEKGLVRFMHDGITNEKADTYFNGYSVRCIKD